MDILTIKEAAGMLRVTPRTLYRHTEIPRIRIGHRLMFIRQDVEAWVLSQRQGSVETVERGSQALPNSPSAVSRLPQEVDVARPTAYHRNPVFRLPSSRSA